MLTATLLLYLDLGSYEKFFKKDVKYNAETWLQTSYLPRNVWILYRTAWVLKNFHIINLKDKRGGRHV